MTKSPTLLTLEQQLREELKKSKIDEKEVARIVAAIRHQKKQESKKPVRMV